MKHDCVKSVTMCEIDEMVIQVAEKYFRFGLGLWDDPRVSLVCQDASEFIKGYYRIFKILWVV